MTLLSHRTILITGASRGIGASVAKRLAREGAHIILTARNIEKLEAVDDAIQQAGGTATIVPLDLSKHDMIDALGAGLLDKFGALDGFIGNAAVLGQLAPLSHIAPKQWHALLDINVTANWRLIRILEPLLKRSDNPRMAFTTSGITLGSAAYWGGYAMSKAALESMVMTYATEQKDSNLRINLIDPGIVATDMRAQAFPGEKKSTLLQPDDISLTNMYVAAMQVECLHHGHRFSI